MPSAGFLGQKSGAGWYRYEAASGRRPLAHPAADALVAAHREAAAAGQGEPGAAAVLAGRAGHPPSADEVGLRFGAPARQ